MIVYKLGGFVNDAHAKLVEVSPKRAVVRLGNCGLVPSWGGSDAKRPVELVVEFVNDPPNLPRSRRVASQQVLVSVRIRPLGWVRSTKVFQARPAGGEHHAFVLYCRVVEFPNSPAPSRFIT